MELSLRGVSNIDGRNQLVLFGLLSVFFTSYRHSSQISQIRSELFFVAVAYGSVPYTSLLDYGLLRLYGGEHGREIYSETYHEY